MRSLDILLPFILFAWGMWSYPVAMLGPERNLIPGDMGDARLNNYVLEHFHTYITGRVDGYWDAPMMYPQPNALARVEGLPGTAPIYSLFRSSGFTRETAFQLWLLVLFGLNYWCTYLVLLASTRRSWLAASGAFFFAFGIYGVAQMDQAQVLPRFLMPVGLSLWWRWLSSARPRYLVLAMVTAVAQFYCAIDLGALLVFAMLSLLLGHALVYRRAAAWSHWKGRATWRPLILTLVVGGALLAPLIIGHTPVKNTSSAHSFQAVVHSGPRPSSLFSAHPAALSWQDLSTRGAQSSPEQWHHYLFVGAMPWLAAIMALVLILRRRSRPDDRRVLATWGLSGLLAMVFCLSVGGDSLWRIFHALPGLGAVDTLDSVVHVHVLFFLFLLVSVADTVARTNRVLMPLAALLPLFLVMDNRIDVDRVTRFDKHRSHREIDQVARHIQVQRMENAKALAWCPVVPPMEQGSTSHNRVITHLTAMLAAQQLGIPSVNAFSGSYPPAFEAFFDQSDRSTLDAWLDASGVDSATVAVMDNLGLAWTMQANVVLTDMAGRYVELRDPYSGVLTLSVEKEPRLASCFTVVTMRDGRKALLGTNGRFVTADISEGDLSLRADAPVVGDFCLFTTEVVLDNGFHLRADNGRWVSTTEGGMLHAWTDSARHATIFRSEPLPEGVQ